MVNDASSLISDLRVFQAGACIYDGNLLYRLMNIKNLLMMSEDYAKNSATSEYFTYKQMIQLQEMLLPVITKEVLIVVVSLLWLAGPKIQ